jgi:hypothetical protein
MIKYSKLAPLPSRGGNLPFVPLWRGFGGGARSLHPHYLGMNCLNLTTLAWKIPFVDYQKLANSISYHIAFGGKCFEVYSEVAVEGKHIATPYEL